MTYYVHIIINSVSFSLAGFSPYLSVHARARAPLKMPLLQRAHGLDFSPYLAGGIHADVELFSSRGLRIRAHKAVLARDKFWHDLFRRQDACSGTCSVAPTTVFMPDFGYRELVLLVQSYYQDRIDMTKEEADKVRAVLQTFHKKNDLIHVDPSTNNQAGERVESEEATDEESSEDEESAEEEPAEEEPMEEEEDDCSLKPDAEASGADSFDASRVMTLDDYEDDSPSPGMSSPDEGMSSDHDGGGGGDETSATLRQVSTAVLGSKTKKGAGNNAAKDDNQQQEKNATPPSRRPSDSAKTSTCLKCARVVQRNLFRRHLIIHFSHLWEEVKGDGPFVCRAGKCDGKRFDVKKVYIHHLATIHKELDGKLEEHGMGRVSDWEKLDGGGPDRG